MGTPVEQNETVHAEQLRDLLRNRPRQSHTHMSVESVVHRLRINLVERFLLWLSKTDYYVLSLCTFHTRVTLASLGMMVIFTTLLAFSSALYSLATTLVDPGSELRWPIAIILASVYAFGILIIDREIVGSVSKKSLLIRLVFAIFIAMAISWPVKLKFFEGRITNEINRMVDEKNADKYARIDALVQQGEPERQEQRKSIQAEVASYDKQIATLDTDIAREQKDIRCALNGRCGALMREKEKIMAARQTLRDSLGALSSPIQLTPAAKNEVDSLRAEIAEEHRVSYDFLTKWEALDRIKKSSGPDYSILSSFIFVFFMLLELVPMMLKWSLGKTEYHYYIEARTNLGNQKIISIANVFLAAMQENPQDALNLPTEITDIIAAHMEDEACEIPRTVDLRGLLATLRQPHTPAPPYEVSENPVTSAVSSPAGQGGADQPAPGMEDETIDENHPPGDPSPP